MFGNSDGLSQSQQQYTVSSSHIAIHLTYPELFFNNREQRLHSINVKYETH